jgi:osmoprotectant transport system ATP-binding protein
MIELKQITKTFPSQPNPAVKDLSLTVAKGETLVLLGSSGSGKSTTLQMINRLMDPDSGDILVRGSSTKTLDPVQLRRSIGYVIQDAGLFPHWNVERNVGAVLELCGESESQISKKTRAALEMVQLDPGAFGSRFPDELSGGQRQRVGVARALAFGPDIALLDEPFSALDGVVREQIQDLFLELKSQLRMTTIFVTHDLFEALRMADRIAVMHEGRMEQVGNPADLIHRPATEFVRELFSKPARQLSLFQDIQP